MTKEYAVEVKVRNNLLLTKMRANGLSAPALAKEAKVALNSIYELLSMSAPAVRQSGEWRKPVVSIATTLRCLPEDIIPMAQVRNALPKNKATVEADADELRSFMLTHQDPSRDIERTQAMHMLAKHVLTLPPRSQDVLARRFGIKTGHEETLGDIGRSLGLSVERVRQIEMKALRKLGEGHRRQELREVAATLCN